MKSLCIKDNNEDVLNFIYNRLLKLDLSSLFVSRHSFRMYKNIIVHFNGDDLSLFYDKLASILSDSILKFYQKRLLRRTLEYNYFYFSSAEKKNILNIAEDFLSSDIVFEEDNFFAVFSAVIEYIHDNNSIVLEGFANFRLSTFMKNLDYIVDLSVNKYITDKEYMEFVNMLKLYVSLTPAIEPIVHLVFLGNESVLLDRDKNIIPLQDDNLNAKYLSDISFSSNDYALNTLLNILPKKLIIHVVSSGSSDADGYGDEFVETIKRIFEREV
ncbi:MAG: hypothetical protein HFJ50_03205 [Clostridia bacterium]|nr:hypothetical protein [Clostridia bacterium]